MAAKKQITRDRVRTRPLRMPNVRLTLSEFARLQELLEQEQHAARLRKGPLVTMAEFIRTRVLAEPTQDRSTPVGTRKQGVGAKKK